MESNDQVKPKPQLHQSQMTQLMRCGEKFRRRYINGEKEKTSTGLIQGTIMHDVAQEILTFKAENNNNVPDKDWLSTIVKGKFAAAWNLADLKLSVVESDLGIEKVKEIVYKTAHTLANKYLEIYAPILVVSSIEDIESPWVIDCVDYPYDLSGRFDFIERYKNEEGKDVVIIRDLKNLKRNPGQKEADQSEQLSFYALAYYVLTGSLPDAVILDCMIKRSEDKADAISFASTRTEEDFKVCFGKLENCCEIIEKEAFTPASRSDWWCSAYFCGFYESCRYVNPKASATVNFTFHGPKGEVEPKTKKEKK